MLIIDVLKPTPSEPKPQVPAEPKAPVAEPKPEPKSEPKAPVVEPKPEPKSEPKALPKPEPKPEPKATPKPEAEPKPAVAKKVEAPSVKGIVCDSLSVLQIFLCVCFVSMSVCQECYVQICSLLLFVVCAVLNS